MNLIEGYSLDHNRSVSEIPISVDRLRDIISRPIDTKGMAFLISGDQVTAGLTDLMTNKPEQPITIPDNPHLFCVNQLTLKSESQEIIETNPLVLFCHGHRKESEWKSADGLSIIDLVWGYNRWVQAQNADLPKIRAIISCSRPETTKTRVPAGFNLKNELRYEERVIPTSFLPGRHLWIPEVIFQEQGILYLTQTQIVNREIHMTVNSRDSRFVEVYNGRIRKVSNSR